MERLALFDVDGTLIDAHGVGGRSLTAAIRDVFGVSGEFDGYRRFYGRTDPDIVAELAREWGAATEEVDERLQECLDVYMHNLQREAVDGLIEVLPGVPELLAALHSDPRVVLGLLTGNMEAGARVKLAPTGLAPLFPVGAFGSDSAVRAELPAVAVARAEELTGKRFAGKEIVVIGDTPADIACGAALGVKAVAVATGSHPVEELAAHAPDHVFTDLSDWRAVYEAILG